jgi:NADH-quinone oxidoreductase subunit L
MGGLRRFMPWTAATMWVATLAIAGVPGLSGFFSKDEILAATFARGHDAAAFYVLWLVGVGAALLTAFYMTRLMLYTFHGPNRTGADETTHLREAPRIMTGPLVVLAVGSIVAGLINLPEILPGSGWLHHWLEPVTEEGAAYVPEAHLTHATEWGLLGLASLVALAGIVGAWRWLQPERLVPAREAPAETGLERVLAHKWYVDELYDRLFVRPIVWLSNTALWKAVDKGVIDGAAVNGSAAVARGLGWIGTRLQTGHVGVYVFLFVVGAWFVLRTVKG